MILSYSDSFFLFSTFTIPIILILDLFYSESIKENNKV